jgi:hypothetical protein
VVLLLAPAAGQSIDAVVDAATGLQAKVGDALGGVTSTSVVPRMATNPVAAYDETDAGGVQSSDFDATVEWRMANEPSEATLAAALAPVASALTGVVDPAASVAVVGREHVFQPDRAPIKLVYCLPRKPGLTTEEFEAGWDAVGAANRRHPSRAGYAQLRVAAAPSTVARQATGLDGAWCDGVAVEWFPTGDALREGIRWSASPESGLGAPDPGTDGLLGLLARFIDFGATRSLLGAEPEATTELAAHP